MEEEREAAGSAQNDTRSDEYERLKRKRAGVSQRALEEMRSRMILTNWRGERKPVEDVYLLAGRHRASQFHSPTH